MLAPVEAQRAIVSITASTAEDRAKAAQTGVPGSTIRAVRLRAASHGLRPRRPLWLVLLGRCVPRGSDPRLPLAEGLAAPM